MPTLTPELPVCPAPRPHHRLVIPDPLEPWTLDDVDFLLWPNSPEHLPGALQELDEGCPDGVAMGAEVQVVGMYPVVWKLNEPNTSILNRRVEKDAAASNDSYIEPPLREQRATTPVTDFTPAALSLRACWTQDIRKQHRESDGRSVERVGFGSTLRRFCERNLTFSPCSR